VSVGLARVSSPTVAQDAYRRLKGRLQELLLVSSSGKGEAAGAAGAAGTAALGEEVLHALLVVLRSNEVRRKEGGQERRKKEGRGGRGGMARRENE